MLIVCNFAINDTIAGYRSPMRVDLFLVVVGALDPSSRTVLCQDEC